MPTTSTTPVHPCRRLIVVLGDQLDADSTVFEGFDPELDWIWMAEVSGEATHVWNSQCRISMFLAAMRHFRDRLRERGWPVAYRQLNVSGSQWSFGDRADLGLAEGAETLASQLALTLDRVRPAEVHSVDPGEWRLKDQLQGVARAAGIAWVARPDQHFFSSPEDFAAHARGRKQLRLEFFYRELRQRTGFLMDGDQPAGGQWNYDAENRESFGKQGPGFVPAPRRFPPDALTKEVLGMVQERFGSHPGSVTAFDWPLTAAEAQSTLDDFIAHRLPEFGRWQDAMWTGEPWLYHSRLSAVLNLKLLHPRTVLEATENAYLSGRVPLPAAEGFIRQILGWREYVRGVYWHSMPGYLERNALGALQPLPRFFWTGDTEFNCLRHSLRQTLDLGYAHHIQRLMVTGLFSLLVGVHPKEVHGWYLAVYVDAVEWVELPNTLGMSQYADGGVMASKPYIATGKYIQRMSNYCQGCRFDPAQATGPKACPFTTLYWDFLARHQALLAKNPRMSLQVRNLTRIAPEQLAAIGREASELREQLAKSDPPNHAVS
ncbi:MAG: cryptochrome/photolyase family protein [Verrucomicrobiota bacterium]|nr:cryptochrome/photolyase family protein [Verrucomicrobiota bacterium]